MGLGNCTNSLTHWFIDSLTHKYPRLILRLLLYSWTAEASVLAVYSRFYRVLSNIISFLGMFNPSGRVLSVSLHFTRNHWHWCCVYPGMAGVIFDTSVPNILKTASDELTQYELYTLYRRNTKKIVYILCWTSSVVFTGTFFFSKTVQFTVVTRDRCQRYLILGS